MSITSSIARKLRTVTALLTLGTVADGEYLKRDGLTIVGGPGGAGGEGSGDVVGPASATDNAITRYHLTTGKAIQNSAATVDDNGSVNIPTGQAYKINGAALAKGDVGLSNVDNVSNVTERAAVATLTNKTLTAPVINSPTGIVKGDVGLGSADNTADADKPVSTATQTALDLKANDADVVHDTGDETIAGVKTFSSDPIIPDEAYGAGWNGSLEPPTKNAVYDKIETLGGGGGIGGSTGSTDNAILRADGAGGATLQSSNLTVGDDGAAINVAAVGAAADIGIALTPKGTGAVNIATAGAADGVPSLQFNSVATGFYSRAASILTFTAVTGEDALEFRELGLTIAGNRQLMFTSGTSPANSIDTGLARGAAAGRIKPTNGSTGYGEFEMAASVRWFSGAGTPEGAVTAGVGSLYTRTDGGAATTLYVKESGTGNTGWVAK